jgi:hypothetical protein
MNAFLQFVNFEQGKELFNLFEVPRCLLGENVRKETYSWIGLDGRKASVNSLDKLFAKTATARFAQLGYETSFKAIKIHPSVSIKEVFGVLQVPSTSPMWADAAYWEIGNNPSVYRRARQAHRVFAAVKRSKVTAFPAVLELTVKLASRLSQDEVAAVLSEWINEKFNNEAFKPVICGVVDFGGNMLFSKMEMLNLEAAEYSMVYFLHRFILGTPLLKKRIDRLHSIQIHERKLISGLAQALSLSEPIYLGNRLSMLSIPKALLYDLCLNQKAAKFLIPRDDTTSWAGLVKPGD